jgi:hypothetical protein
MGTGCWLGAIALVLALGGGAGAAGAPHDELDRARAEMAQAAREYRQSLEPLVALHADAAARAAAAAARHRDLVDGGIVSRREVEAAEQAAAAAREVLERTRARVREADAMVAEAEAARQLASLPPPRAGETGPTPPNLVRFGGWAEWSLAMAPRLEAFFQQRFGRPLPVSAFGQTAVHDRLGFDHRDALDVAVHPDSPEGEAVMTWLRQHGVSFLAFRAPVAGEATGAHVHVGDPSPRLAARPR